MANCEFSIVFQSIIRLPEVSHHGAMAQVCRARGAVDCALALLSDVTARRWRIDAEAMAMAAMAAEGRWQRALAFWDETRQVSGPNFCGEMEVEIWEHLDKIGR